MDYQNSCLKKETEINGFFFAFPYFFSIFTGHIFWILFSKLRSTVFKIRFALKPVCN
jgi:hypothetical protein